MRGIFVLDIFFSQGQPETHLLIMSKSAVSFHRL
jgi:hypothetical protein